MNTLIANSKLIQTLIQLEGKPYPAYKSLKNGYQYHGYELWIDHVQGDPFAVPSKVRAKISMDTTGFPSNTYSGDSRNVALCDFLARRFFQSICQYNKDKEGSGKSSLIEIDRPGQEVLKRSSVVILGGFLEVRFLVGLPAYGRRIAGKVAAHMFSEIIPQIIHNSLYFQQNPQNKLYRHIETIEDADYIRAKLPEFNLVAFVADKAILPRASGIDQRPLRADHVVSFESCQSLRVSMDLPNHGTITGMGIPKGVTLIVGGGYHGKSTLLNALEHGVYNHIPDDGREFVITSADAVKIRAEDGRSIQNLNISPFISNLPFAQDTVAFSTLNASGSTSQAANILEAVEIGASTLLLDEDTLATNFMIRDKRMKALIAREKEPIVPFIDHIRGMYEKNGISTILVMGGCGDYFDFADVVIGMIEYRPHDLTEQARHIVKTNPLLMELHAPPLPEISRVPLAHSLDASKGKKPASIKSEGTYLLFYGIHRIQVDALEQLVHPSQLRAIGYAIYYARKYIDGKRNMHEICAQVLAKITEKGLDCLAIQEPRGDFAEFRSYELAATLNRFRKLRIK
ncbi:MAG: ABC-ATPase domain-containing protein [Candidatus Brocadiaceae bacterium]|nr:ABC-ATPase domain-containing protein [Candidatus Brocadiaceae bacterium]